jgi:hypothetical protein
MAEVTGMIGGQPVELNNAATEATLKQLLAAMQAMLAAQGKGGGGKAQKDLEKRLKDLAKATEEQQKQAKELTAAQKKLIATQKEAEEAAEKQKQAYAALGDVMSSFTSTVLKTATGMTNLLSSLANMGDSLTSAAQSLSAIPVVGGAVASVFGAVAGAAEKTYKSLQQASAVGASFGGSMTEMINSATSAGLTFDQFSGIISRTGADLALLGGSTGEGAKRLAAMGKAIKGTDLERNLAAMGYSTEMINEGLAKYSGMLARTGTAQNMTNAQLTKVTGDYLTNLDAVSRLTGQNKKDIEAEREARLKDAQVRAMLAGKSAEEQEAINKLLDTIPAEHGAGMKEILATGTATSEAGRAAFAFLPGTAKQMMNLNNQMNKGVKITAQQTDKVQAGYQKEAKALAASPLGKNLALFGTEAEKALMIGAYNTAAQTKNMEQVNAEIQAERDKNKTAEAAAMNKMKQQIAETSNEFTKILASSKLLPAMMDAFKLLVSFTDTFVVPAFQFIGDNASTVGVALGAMAALIVGVNAVLAIEAMRKKILLALEVSYIKALVGKLAASLPFLKIAVPILALVGIFKLLYDNFDGFADVIDTMTDAFLRLLHRVTFGAAGISAEEMTQRSAARAARKEAGISRKDLAAQQQAQPTGIAGGGGGASYLQTIAQIESGGNPNAKASTSSAAGMFQFTEGTWKDMTKKMGKNYTLEDRFDPKKSAEVAQFFTAQNKKTLESGTGRAASNTDQYMAHFLGAGGAVKFLNAMQQNPNAIAADMDPKAAAANKNIFYDKDGRARTLREVYDLMHGKVSKAEGLVASGKTTQHIAALGGGTAAPSGSQVVAATAPSSSVAAATASSSAAAAPSAGAPGAVQESPSAILAQINSKMDLILKVGRDQTNLKERQMTAMKVAAASSSGGVDMPAVMGA